MSLRHCTGRKDVFRHCTGRKDVFRHCTGHKDVFRHCEEAVGRRGNLLIILLLLGIIFLIPSTPVLAISSRKNPNQRFYSKAGYKNGFIISYTHSVNKGRVHDTYTKTENNQLKLDRTIFVSYGAGIPEPEETPGAVFTVLENGYEISNLNRIVPKLTMAVGIIANHAITFYYGQEALDYPLTDFFEPQTSIILKIKKVNLLEYIFHKLKKIGEPHGRFRK